MESGKSHKHLSLAEAQASGRLDEFIRQEEARRVEPAPVVELDAALSRIITAGKSEDQTLRSASSDGSSGTKTR
jgi:hypothetical protein